MVVMTEATLSHLEFLILELSKPPVPEKLGWLSLEVLTAFFLQAVLGLEDSPGKHRASGSVKGMGLPFHT